MEEEKVTMSGQNPETEEKKDNTMLSYDDLMNTARQLAQQNNVLRNKVDELLEQLNQMGGAQTRLHYLFKILENKFAFDSDYIIETADEIKQIMTIKEPNSEEETNQENK